jgi:chromosomal replication initiator protein
MELATGSSGNGGGYSSELWDTALAILEPKYTKPVFEMWLKPMRLLKMEGTEISLSVHTQFARDWVENRLKSDIAEVLERLVGEPVTLTFVIVEGGQQGSERVPGQPERGAGARSAAFEEVKRSFLNSRYTFQEFVIGNSNRFAHAASQAVAEAPAKAYNPLFLYGGVGLGKTHLMHAIGHRVLAEKPDAKIVYVSSEKFTNEFIIAIKNNQTPEFRAKYRHADVLLIDDIQFLEGKEQTQEEFFHTFNSLHDAHKQLVISSDRPPKEIQTLESRLRSRFEWGLLTDIQPPDLETREAILRKKGESEKIPVPDEVTSYIAKMIQSNIRELEGALIRVVAFASLTNSPITAELAAECLKNVVANMPARRITIQLIKEKVATAHGLTVKEMDNHRRDQRLAGPRQIAMYLSTELTDCSLPQIAREFAKKDHTTVIYARNKIKQLMANDEAYRNRVRSLLALCQAD